MATIPHPPRRIPYVGDVIGASRTRPVQDSMALADRLGPIFTRKAFSRETVFVHGVDLVGELSDEDRFGKHLSVPIERLRRFAGDGLFTAYDDEPNWELAHAILMPAFTKSAMRRYHDTMLATTGLLLDAWDEHCGNAAVDVTPDMTRMTLETIGLTAFGYSFGAFERTEPHPVVDAMLDALRYAQSGLVEPPIVGPLRREWKGARVSRAIAQLDPLVDGVIEQRRERLGAADSEDDLLALMLDSRHPETGRRLDERTIRNEILTFFVAGHETTAGALSFALYYLSRDPDIAERAQREVDEVWGDVATPSYEQVTKLRYTRRVFDEALRLWPTVPGYAREARQDTLLGGRYPLRKGQWALVLVPSLHRDPVWGHDPERFDPERFTPEALRSRPAHAYRPFGTGPRACIGRQFALHEAVLVLGSILRRYRLVPDPAYRLRISEQLTLRPAGFRLGLERRNAVGRATS